MGLKCDPDFAQQIMEQVLHRLDSIKVYINNIGVFENTWEEHQGLLNKILSCPEPTGFTANPLKCAWAIKKKLA